MAKWKEKLVVSDLKDFSKKIYQDENCINDYKMANEIIEELKNNLSKVYDFLDNIYDIVENEEIENKIEEYLIEKEIDVYQVGDTINLLDNIKITKNIL